MNEVSSTPQGTTIDTCPTRTGHTRQVSTASAYRETEEDIGVQEMLMKYQQKYRRQKEESIGGRKSLSPCNEKRVSIGALGVSEVQHHEES
jgi:hypothetical protein